MKSPSLPKCPALLAKTLAHPVVWIAIAVIVLFLDWLAGPAINFPFVFIFPVALAAWHRGFRAGALFALGLPLVRFGFNFFRDTPWSDLVSAINLGIRVLVLCSFAWMIAQTVKQQRQIKTLERLLPICAWCGKIRDNKNAWQRLDSYLAARTDLSFSHTICSECSAKHLSQQLLSARAKITSGVLA
jgi:hypothetical protein